MRAPSLRQWAVLGFVFAVAAGISASRTGFRLAAQTGSQGNCPSQTPVFRCSDGPRGMFCPPVQQPYTPGGQVIQCQNTGPNGERYDGVCYLCRSGQVGGSASSGGNGGGPGGNKGGDEDPNACLRNRCPRPYRPMAGARGQQCGNGVIDMGSNTIAPTGEQCDPPNFSKMKGANQGPLSQLLCTELCSIVPECGNGVVEESNKEECDDGDKNGATAAQGGGYCTKDCTLQPGAAKKACVPLANGVNYAPPNSCRRQQPGQRGRAGESGGGASSVPSACFVPDDYFASRIVPLATDDNGRFVSLRMHPVPTQAEIDFYARQGRDAHDVITNINFPFEIEVMPSGALMHRARRFPDLFEGIANLYDVARLAPTGGDLLMGPGIVGQRRPVSVYSGERRMPEPGIFDSLETFQGQINATTIATLALDQRCLHFVDRATRTVTPAWSAPARFSAAAICNVVDFKLFPDNSAVYVKMRDGGPPDAFTVIYPEQYEFYFLPAPGAAPVRLAANVKVMEPYGFRIPSRWAVSPSHQFLLFFGAGPDGRSNLWRWHIPSNTGHPVGVESYPAPGGTLVRGEMELAHHIRDDGVALVTRKYTENNKVVTDITRILMPAAGYASGMRIAVVKEPHRVLGASHLGDFVYERYDYIPSNYETRIQYVHMDTNNIKTPLIGEMSGAAETAVRLNASVENDLVLSADGRVVYVWAQLSFKKGLALLRFDVTGGTAERRTILDFHGPAIRAMQPVCQ